MSRAPKPKVAIACQGGGSHAAYGAGVLQRLLADDLRERYELVGLSGTSGGAMCAALAWTGLHLGGADDAIARLQAFWDDVKARAPIDAALNRWGVWTARLPVTSEWGPFFNASAAEGRLLALIERHIPLADVTAARRRRSPLRLLVGATDVHSGERTVFATTAITPRHLLASAAVPPIFPPIEIDGRFYWDGLFTTNPPIRELTDLDVMAHKPDEIWVVQINPHQAPVPALPSDIVDRRNELSGNLALAQELYFIDRINELVKRYPALRSDYQHIGIRVIEMSVPKLDYVSKLDRSPELIDTLMRHGRQDAEGFLTDARWPDGGSLPSRNRCVV